MKKVWIGVLSGAVALGATGAFAGVTATKHDMGAMGKTVPGTTARGVCSYCHVPHGAQGARLWAGAPATLYTPVANLCATCHLNNSVTDPAAESRGMFLGSSHGFDETVIGAAAGRYGQGTSLATSGLPYTTDATTDIDCTSCHDPHSNTAAQRPFLRSTLVTLCQRCHGQRTNTGIMSANTNAGAELGSQHPVGASYVGNATRPIAWSAPYQVGADIANASNATEGKWLLGGHRTDGAATGGVTCVTCHIVHGTDPVNGGTAPANDLLVKVKNSAAGDLCTDCHTTNPGTATNGTHPVASGATPFTGSVTANTLTIDAQFLNNDLTAPDAVYDGAGALVCLSCHDTHFGMNNSPILADTTTVAAFCTGCHTTAPITDREHHPATGVAATTYDSATYATVADTTDFFSATLDCETCHRAHNAVDQNITGSSADFLLRARNWEGATGTANTPTSTMCVACHSANPARYRYSVEGAATEIGSHWVSHAGTLSGTNAVADLTTGGENTTALPGIQTNYASGNATAPIRTTLWPNTGLAYAGNGNTDSYSKVGNVAFSFDTGPASNVGGMLCESCHSVTNPRSNSYLLLGNFSTGARNAADNRGTAFTATNQTAQGGDGLCLGCHGIPTGTHPTTASIVTKTNAALATVSAFADAAPSGGEAFYPAANELTCTSCHDTHSGNTGAAIYILKQGATAAAMGAAANLTQGVSLYTGSTPDAAINFTDLCAACHSVYR